jgi:diaminohydroxyphosphoribosylaminopyrimidine deaminase/5-amino-6-(5-phosphoribosylamino)uracil reductase
MQIKNLLSFITPPNSNKGGVIFAMDKKYMKRAIELALRGSGFTNPNPLVGAVIVKNGKIIGEGFHRRYGALHAERDALKNCTEDARGADMYVTLEPCCHYGKQPPCTHAVAQAGIKNVYIGSYDPNPLVSGKGTAYLREKGINVTENVLRKECDEINRIFFHYITQKRPYVILKAAMSIDGRTATRSGDSKWITNEISRENVHLTRKRAAAIMVGINTVLADNPMLNCRCENPSQPVRVVCDSRLRIPLDSRLVQTAKEIPLIIACAVNDEEKAEKLHSAGAEVIVTGGGERVDIKELMNILGEKGIDSVLVEGGSEIHASILENKLADELNIYIAPKIIGGRNARPAVGGDGIDKMCEAYEYCTPEVMTFGSDIMLRYCKRSSEREV